MKLLELIMDFIKQLMSIFKYHEELSGSDGEELNPDNEKDKVVVPDPPPPVVKLTPIGVDRLAFADCDQVKLDALIKRYGHFKTKFEGVTLHNNGNTKSTAANDVNWALNNIGRANVSWHYSVDDKQVVRFLAARKDGSYSAWAAGDGARGFGNSKTINIEINEFSGWANKADPKWKAARKNAVHLVAALLHFNKWGISNIYTHRDHSPSNKNCPRVILRDGLEDFKAEVLKVLNELNRR